MENKFNKSSFLKSFTILLILLVNIKLSGQSAGAKNSIYFEALGNGITYSINYDRMFTENLGGRIGFSYLSELDFVVFSFINLVTVPVTLNYFIESGNHNLE